jgi:Undecaprenyl-phosphate glucose phosphotransferase
MIKQRSQILCVWFMVWDVVLTVLAWLAAYFVRFETGWLPITKTPPDFFLCLYNLPLVLFISSFAYRLTGQYEINRLRHFHEEVVSVLKGVALISLLMMAATFYLHHPYESRGSMILFSVLTMVLLLGMRRSSWTAIRWLRRRGYNQTCALIVGTGRVARNTARYLRRATWLGIKPLGFIEDQPSSWSEDLDILGGTSDLPMLVEKYRVPFVFICLPLHRYQEVRSVVDVLSQTLTEVRLVADVPGLAGLSLGVGPMDDMTMISLRESPHYGINVLVKRVMDIALSLTALFVLSPVLCVIAALVKLTSRGPVFYAQERCSLNGRPFKMLKFRSMRVDAESQSGAVWAQKDDPRRTALGTFLRRSSLDELPQLLNVLMGDMSLVGPRPERPVFIQKFRKTIPNYMARHAVKCGITGWAQVHGWRGNTSLRKRVQYDLYYITHWSPWLDFRILWLTAVRAVFDRNAY